MSNSATLSLPKMHKTHLIAVGFCGFSVSCQLTHHSIIARRWRRCDRWPQIFEFWVVRGFLHFLFKLITQRHEFNPSVVAMAERILITVWMISFQVSLFFIVVNGLRTPSKDPPSRRGLRSPHCDTDWHLVNPLKVLFAPSMGRLVRRR